MSPTIFTSSAMRFIRSSVWASVQLVLGCLLPLSAIAVENGITDPTQFMFVAERERKVIHAIRLDDLSVAARFEISIEPDHVIAPPFAPVLAYIDTDAEKIGFLDLSSGEESKAITLPLVPRHAVLDTSGARIGISDSVDGGFALINVFTQELELNIADFPASPDVLFDPNDVDIYFSNKQTGSIGRLNTVTRKWRETELTGERASLSAPSRSLDSRYLYVSNYDSGEVFLVNAWSLAVFESIQPVKSPARPYSTPQGAFLYIMDRSSGRLQTYDQNHFKPFANADLGDGVDLVAVGRFDRMNLFLSTRHQTWYLFDNLKKSILKTGKFDGMPLGVFGSADGKTAYIGFRNSDHVAAIDLESGKFEQRSFGGDSATAFTLALSNNVCH